MARGPASASVRRASVAVVAIGVLVVAGVALPRYVRGMRSLRSAVVVTFGDSLTEGGGSTRAPWPDVLAARLRARPDGSPTTVVNAGISGNRLLVGGMGESGLRRFGPDVVERPRVRWVTVLEGTNDLGFPGSVEPAAPPVGAEQLVAAYSVLVERAHAAGLRIYLGTLPPFEGADGGYFTPDKERVRQSVNAWIRTSGRADAVLDFDEALRDPTHPARLLPAYDSGDHLHPNDAGHRAMGELIDLRLFE